MFFYHLALAFHLIGIVCWFAGLFYLGRLCIYHREAMDKPQPEQTILKAQFTLMENRLWSIITVPALWVTAGTGISLLTVSQVYHQPWFIIKIVLLILLFGYHLHCGKLVKQLQMGQKKWNSTGLRVYNEIATLLLFAIVFCAKLKEPQSIGLALIGVLGLGIIIFLFIKALRRKKDKD